jgi:hypothetical protein
MLNWLLYRFNWVYANRLKHRKPICVDLELSAYCNMKCPMCYHNETPKFKQGLMDWGVARRALLQAHQLHVPSIKLNFRGEPTLNPFFKKICEFARGLAKGYIFQERITNTNMFFDPKNEDIFKGLLAQNYVKISLDTFDPDIYKVVRKGGVLPATLYNINKLYTHPDREKAHQIILYFTRTKATEKEDFKALAQNIWPKIKVVVKDSVNGRGCDISPKEKVGKRQCCVQPFARAMVLWDGRITMCCPNFNEHDALMVGHVEDEGIYKSFNSAKAVQIRKDLKSGKAFLSEPCLNCPSFESFAGFKSRWHA